jgi:hypothetical protein
MITAPVGLDLKRENVPRELKELVLCQGSMDG